MNRKVRTLVEKDLTGLYVFTGFSTPIFLE